MWKQAPRPHDNRVQVLDDLELSFIELKHGKGDGTRCIAFPGLKAEPSLGAIWLSSDTRLGAVANVSEATMCSSDAEATASQSTVALHVRNQSRVSVRPSISCCASAGHDFLFFLSRTVLPLCQANAKPAAKTEKDAMEFRDAMAAAAKAMAAAEKAEDAETGPLAAPKPDATAAKTEAATPPWPDAEADATRRQLQIKLISLIFR